MRYSIIPVKSAVPKIQEITRVGEELEKWEHSCSDVGKEKYKVVRPRKAVWRILKKSKNRVVI